MAALTRANGAKGAPGRQRRPEMLQQGMTVLMEYDENDGWHETEGSVKHRIREALGFDKHEVSLMETGSKNGITETAAFTVRGLGWFIDFTNDKVGRAEAYDEKPSTDNVVEAYRQCGGGEAFEDDES